MFNALKTRWEHTKTIGKTWWSLAAVLWAFFWAADAAIEKWDLFGLKVWWDENTTHLPTRWQEWLIGLLVLLLFGLIEGSFRHHQKTVNRHTEELANEKVRNQVAPHMDIVPLLGISRGAMGKGITDIFLNVRLVLTSPSEVSIQDFSLTMLDGGRATEATFPAAEDMTEWELIKKLDGNPLHVACVPMTKTLTRRGDPIHGWIHFPISGLTEQSVANSTLTLEVNCTFGTCYTNLGGTFLHSDPDVKGTMRRIKLP